jgi:hypothetical protein
MGDKILAGYETVGVYEPIQLYAGEADTVSTQEVLTAGQNVGQLNARNETFKFPVVSMVGGKLVAYNKEGADGSEVPYGILPHALDASATGYNADVDTPVFVGGVFNFEALDADGATYAALKAAFARTNIVIQKLY